MLTDGDIRTLWANELYPAVDIGGGGLGLPVRGRQVRGRVSVNVAPPPGVSE